MSALFGFCEFKTLFQEWRRAIQLFFWIKDFSNKILLQKSFEHLEPIVIFARVLLKSLFEPLFISQLHKCSSCFAWKGHTLTRPNRSQELGPADIILTWVGQINWKFNTLTVSLFQFPKDKLFLLKIFLVHNQLEKNWSAKNVLSMDGNGNNPIYSLLSTWISTWTEPETNFG